MTYKYKILLTTLLALMSISFIGGCTYSAPWKRTELGKRMSRSSTPVVVTLTYAKIKPGKRIAFFKEVMANLSDLQNYQGLIGHSYRFEIFGLQAWTVSAWENAESRDRFTEGNIHRRSVKASGGLVNEMRFKSIELSHAELPLAWTKAITLLKNASSY